MMFVLNFLGFPFVPRARALRIDVVHGRGGAAAAWSGGRRAGSAMCGVIFVGELCTNVWRVD